MIAWIALPTHTVNPVAVGILDLAKQYYDLGYSMIRIYFKDSESAPLSFWDYPSNDALGPKGHPLWLRP